MAHIIKFQSHDEAEREELKKRLCDAIDKGDWFIHAVFAKGLLQHASDCLHDHTNW